MTWLADYAGTHHKPAGAEARILSLVPSITELLFDLNLASSLVGRTHYCVHPKNDIDAFPSVGGTKKVVLDRVRELAPTHVIVNVDENTKEQVWAWLLLNHWPKKWAPMSVWKALLVKVQPST